MEEILLMTIKDCEDILLGFTRRAWVFDGLMVFTALGQGAISHYPYFENIYTQPTLLVHRITTGSKI